MMEQQRDSLKSSNTDSTKGKEAKKLSTADTKFLYLSTNRQADLATESKWEGTSQLHNEQNRQPIEQTIDVERRKEFLVQKGKQLYEKIQKNYSSLDKEEIQKKRNNYERRYDTKIAETLFEEAPYNKDSTEVLPSAFTVETRVKGYPRVCYWNSVNLEKGIIWADGNYKSIREKPALKRILSLQEGIDQIETVNKILEAAEEQKMSERTEGAEIFKKLIEKCKLAININKSEEILKTLKEIMDLSQKKEARGKQRAQEGKYDNEVEPFEIDEAGKKVQVRGTKPSFNSDVIGYQIDFLMKEKKVTPERFVLTKCHSMDVINTESVGILNLYVDKNSTKIFQKDNDEFFAMLLAPNIKRTFIMAAQHFSDVELSKIEVERRNSDTKIHRLTCYFNQKDPRV